MLIKDKGNIKDRGNIKWTSLMLVEHKRKLRQLKNQEQDREKPELDPQQLEHMNYVLQNAISEERSVKIEYYQERRIHRITGRVKKVLKAEEQLIVKTEGSKKNLHLQQILNIMVMD